MELKEVFPLLGIPDEIRRAYENKGLKSLYAWQADCLLSTNVLRGDSLLYCAPTSGGKTIVAELILLKTALVLRQQVIFVLPYVSLVFEKEKYLKKLVSSFNRGNSMVGKISIRSYYGGKVIKHGKRANIMVCTIEKANGLVNQMLERGKLKDLGCVVVDEAHVISNSLNGYMLEILIAKLKFVNNNRLRYIKLQMSRPIQIIAMSATVGNVAEISNWLQAKLYISHFRPVPLHEYIKVQNEVFSLNGNLIDHIQNQFANDNDDIGYLCCESLQRDQQVLVFCATKMQCSVNCRLIVNVIKSSPLESFLVSTIEQRRAVVKDIEQLERPGNQYDSLLKESILFGVAYHNSNLDQPVREIIESAYLSGLIRVLVATTTLAAGVNLPAGRVIITSMMLGRDPLTVGHYKQMTGRAGRAGHCNFGESFLLVKRHELAKAFDLTNQALPNIESALGPARDGGNAVLRMLIEASGLGLTESVQDSADLLSQSLFYHLISVPNKVSIIGRLIVSSLKFLRDGYIMQLDNDNVACEMDFSIRASLTRLGKALMKAGIDIDEGIIIYEGLLRAQQGLVLDSPLQLLYLVAPYNCPLMPNYLKLSSIFDKSARVGRRSVNSDSEVMSAIGLDFPQLSRWLARPPTYSDVQQSSGLLRQGFLQSYAELCREALISSQHPISDEQVSEYNAPPLLKTNGRKLSFNESKTLCASRRMWSALILRKVLEGFQIESVAREFECSRMDIENLIRDARIKLQVTKKLCEEMGWSTFTSILNAFSVELKFDDVKLVGNLLSIEGMTHKMARILVDNGISTIALVAQQSSATLTQYFMLSLGFHLQDKDSICTEFLLEDDSAATTKGSHFFKLVTGRDDESDGRPTKTARTEGDAMKIRMDSLTTMLVSNAKKLQEEESNLGSVNASAVSVNCIPIDENVIDEEILLAVQSIEQEYYSSYQIQTEHGEAGAKPNTLSSALKLNDGNEMQSEDEVQSDIDEQSGGEDDNEDEEDEEEHIDTFLNPCTFETITQPESDIIVPIGDFDEGDCLPLNMIDVPMSIGSAVFTPQAGVTSKSVEKTEQLMSINISTCKKSCRKVLHTLAYESDLIELLSDLEKSTNLVQVPLLSQSLESSIRDTISHSVELVSQYEPVSNRSTREHSMIVDQIRIDITSFTRDPGCSPPLVRLQDVPDVAEYALKKSLSISKTQMAVTSEIRQPLLDDLDDELLNCLMDCIEARNGYKLFKTRTNSVDSEEISAGVRSRGGQRRQVSFFQEENALSQRDPASKLNYSGATDLFIERSQSKKVPPSICFRNTVTYSPYLTPFAVSETRGPKPGTYLYHPTISMSKSAEKFDAVIGSTNKILSLFAIEFPHSIVSKLLEWKSVSSKEIEKLPITSISDPNAFSSFVAAVKTSKCVSFELVFREIPTSLLTRKQSSNTHSVSSLPLSFTHLVSQFCSSATNVTCTIADLALPNVIHDFAPGNIKKRQRIGGFYVLCGLSLYTGSDQGYYLSLPNIPLIEEQQAEDYLQSLRAHSSTPLTTKSKWSLLPLCLLTKIAEFVGFTSILKNTAHLAQHLHVRDYVFPKGQNYPAVLESNRMMLVCKSWAIASSVALVRVWRGGYALPWIFLNTLFRDPSICKMSNHIKNKLQCLRERDILPQGHLLDPGIAFRLLPEDCHKHENDFVLSRLTVQHSAQQILPFHKKATYLQRLGICVSGIRAAMCWSACIQAGRFLQQYELLDMYHNIEMPLSVPVAEMEMNGIGIDVRVFRELKSIIEDRQRTIEALVFHYFHNQKRYNLDSVPDVREIQRKLPSMNIMKTSLPTADSTRSHHDGQSVSSDWNCGNTNKTLNYPQHALHNEQLEGVAEGAVPPCEHVVMSLIREHRRHVKLLPMLISLLRNQCKHRVYGYFHQLGTITGRMIASHPPLQQIPKESSFIPSVRLNLLHEMICAWDDAKRPSWNGFLQHVNQSLRQKNLSEHSTTLREWVRIVPAQERSQKDSHVMKNELDDLPLAIKAIAEEFSVGILLEIVHRSSTGPSPGANTSLPEFDSLIGVVQFGDVQSLRAMSGNATSVHTAEYPLSRIRRLNASIQPTSAEIALLQKVMVIDQCQSRFARTRSVVESVDMMVGDDGNISDTILHRQALCQEYLSMYEMRPVRKGFVASAGFVLLAADYSQIELRMLAHLSMDPDLCAAFHSGQDVFRDMASRWLQKPSECVTDSERNRIKQICYSFLYGAGPSLIAANAGVSMNDAEDMLADFERKFPGIRRFLTSVKQEAQTSGKIRTILGRQRWLPELKSKEHKTHAAGERRAVNSLCQGSAADLIKLAMINIQCKLEEWSEESIRNSNNTSSNHVVSIRQKRTCPGAGLYRRLDDVRLILQIHDELVYEVRPDHVAPVASIIRECMENALLLHVPLEVKLSTGTSWGSMTPLMLPPPPSPQPIPRSPYSPTDADIFPNYVPSAIPGGVSSSSTSVNTRAQFPTCKWTIAKNLFGSEG